MSKKKIIYIAMGVIAVVLGYLNYFGSDKEVGDIRKIIETVNAVYESDDYHVEAEKEIDYIDEKESKFEKAKAKIQGMLLSGDNVFLDKDRNLTLDTNILGISPNGWEIKASELKFNKETKDGHKMQHYSHLLQKAVESIISVKEERDIDSLFSVGETTALENNIKGLDDFELITFLVLKHKE